MTAKFLECRSLRQNGPGRLGGSGERERVLAEHLESHRFRPQQQPENRTGEGLVRASRMQLITNSQCLELKTKANRFNSMNFSRDSQWL